MTVCPCVSISSGCLIQWEFPSSDVKFVTFFCADRMPPGQAMALTHELDFGNSLKDNLFIDLSAENRWGKVRYGGEVINAKVTKNKRW